ncbi:preprotein translocase subunit SecG [Halioxenophilus sp. WMMB6]|uniref:preprotein translocase subunit SecG n=1 Tax=Halioxenophilus sp. WMMB6 TaxID=3073815 RepID=UPI00295EF59E|nr:preprotein translocase subunit SecG [Halioxenophilus sp. WMMB6]
METIVIVVFLLVSFAIIGLILLQQGKGAEMGASFGSGASGTVFGSSGGGNFFSRLTAILATIFFLLAFGLTYIAKQKSGVEELPALLEQSAVEAPVVESDIPTSEETPAVDSDVPVVEAPMAEDVPPTSDDVPTAEDSPVTPE